MVHTNNDKVKLISTDNFCLSATVLWMVHPQGNLEERVDEQAPDSGPCCGSRLLWPGLGWALVEREANGMCH